MPTTSVQGSGDTVDLLGYAYAERATSGWLLVSGIASTRGHFLALYDSSGRLEKTFARGGQGPGELTLAQGQPNLSGAGFVQGDSILVADGWNSRVNVFAPPPDAHFVRSYTLKRTGAFRVSTRGLLSGAFKGAPTFFAHLVNADSARGQMVGIPPRLLSLDGEEIARFGDVTYDRPDREVFGALAPADSDRVWVGKGDRYVVELRERGGKVVRRLERSAPWFPVDTAKPAFPWVKPPPTVISAMAQEDSVLWVLISRASRHWAERRPKNPPAIKPGMPPRMMPQYSRGDLFEYVLEAIDARSGRLLTSRELDGDYRRFNGSGELVRAIEDGSGAFVLELSRLQLKRR